MQRIDFIVCESQIEYDHFSRMMKMIVNQPEFRPSGGILIWAFLYHCRKLIWYLDVKRKKPFLFTIEHDGAVVGGFTLSRSGEIGNAVVTKEPAIKSQVIKLLLQRVMDILMDGSRYLRVRTLETNTSLIHLLLRRGFSISSTVEYVITIPLGPLTFSWIARTPPRYLKHFLLSRTLKLLERPSEVY